MGHVEFSELEFKWSVHVIDELNQLHAIHISLLFPMIYFYHGSEKCKKLAILRTTNMASYMYNKISIATDA